MRNGLLKCSFPKCFLPKVSNNISLNNIAQKRRIFGFLREFGTSNSSSTERKKKEEKTMQHNIWNVPNAITMTRIASTPYISWLVLNGQYETALAGLALAGFSDWLDGYIAKRFNQQTIVGSFLDPLADKWMIGVLSITLAQAEILPWSLVGLMLGRDIYLVMGTIYHRYRTKKPNAPFFNTTDFGSFEVKPTWISKVNTALQISLLVGQLSHSAWTFPAAYVMAWWQASVAVTTVASGLDYTYQYLSHTNVLRAIYPKRFKKPY